MNDVAPQGIQRYDNAEYDIELDHSGPCAVDRDAAVLAARGEAMSEHLPECFWTDTPLKPKKVRGLCICARLRDCAARVQLDEWEAMPADSVSEGVRLLQTIGLDITYTDEGLAVIVRQMLRMGQRDEREACIALVETVAQSGAYIDYVEIDSVIAAIRARSDGGES